ncbi:MAG: hypothetical protein IT204_12130 [Fimbriimonadaceae bacterium]|nr:hypothetical protein [Fimbriimonadaceae bacterium]
MARVGGDQSTLEALLKEQQAAVSEVHRLVARLLELTPQLQRRMRDELALHVEPDYSLLSEALTRLQAATRRSAQPASPRRSKPRRFMLVHRGNGEPVLGPDGQPLTFRTKLQVLRGPRYAALLGSDGVQQVQIVDTQRDNAVVVDRLRLGPAPGGRRRRENQPEE